MIFINVLAVVMLLLCLLKYRTEKDLMWYIGWAILIANAAICIYWLSI